MSWLSEKINKVKVEYKQASAANEQIKKKQQVAYYQAKEKESLRLAREQARLETNEKIKALKTKPSQSFGFGGSILGNSPGMSNLFYGEPAKPARKQHRKRKPVYKTVRVRVR